MLRLVRLLIMLKFGISCEVIDIRSLTNLKKQKIYNSIKKPEDV